MPRVWLRTLLAVLLVVGYVPARAQDASAGPCDDVASQVDATAQQLDQERQNAEPWLVQASQAAPIVLAELMVAAAQGAPDLTPGLAGSLGAIVAQIDAWRNAGGSIRDLAGQLPGWEITLSTVMPFAGGQSAADRAGHGPDAARSDCGQRHRRRGHAGQPECAAAGLSAAEPAPSADT